MRRIGSIIIKDAPPLVPDVDAAQILKDNTIILNKREPLSSDDLRDPLTANYFKGDDYVYHFINGLWKRTSLNKFNIL
jgi:hypothetical protein